MQMVSPIHEQTSTIYGESCDLKALAESAPSGRDVLSCEGGRPALALRSSLEANCRKGMDKSDTEVGAADQL